MTEDNFKELLRTLDRQTRAIEDVKRAVDYGTTATERVQREVWWLFAAIMAIAATLLASGASS